MTNNGIKKILSKDDWAKKAQRNSPQMKIIYDKLKHILPNGIYKLIYFDAGNKLCIGYHKSKISIKYADRVIDQAYVLESKDGSDTCTNLNEALCMFLKGLIKLNGGCQGFNFDIEYINFTLIPQAKEKWFYKTGGLVNFRDYIYNVINHYDLDDWKSYLDLTKVKSMVLIESLIMHKIYRIAQ